MTKLTLIRGLPGSGKSTLARSLNLEDHYEADMFFEQDGEYKFDKTKLHVAHKWCMEKTSEALKINRDVVVSNTFTTASELTAYLTLAFLHNAEVEVIEVLTQFESIRNVPEETFNRMKKRWTSNDRLKYIIPVSLIEGVIWTTMKA